MSYPSFLRSITLTTLIFLSALLNAQCSFTLTADSVNYRTCKYAVEDLVWTNLTSTATAQNSVIKTAATAAWDADAISPNLVHNNGFMQTVVVETNTSRMIGLNTVNSNASYTDLEYAFFLVNNRSLAIYENGTNRGTWGLYSAGDTLRIAVMNNTVFYIQNNNIIYTSSVTPTLPMFVDISILTVNGTLQNVVVGNGTDSLYSVFESNPGGSPTYQWKLNGGNVGTGLTTYANNLSIGDSLECNLIPSLGGCSGSGVVSNTLHINNYKLDRDINFNIRNDSVEANSCLFLTEDISWNSLSGVAINGTNNVIKTTNNANWNAGGFSLNKVENGGFVETIANETNTYRMIGLNSTNANISYTDIDYAIYLVNNGSISIYENGTNKGSWGSYSTGDTLRVAVVGNQVRYLQNGNVIYTSTIAPTLPLYVDMSLHTLGATLESVRVSNPAYGRFIAEVNGLTNVNYQWKLNGANVGSNSPNYTNTSLVDTDSIICTFSIDGTYDCGTDTSFNSNIITVEDNDPKGNLIFSIRNDSIVATSCKYAYEEVAWQSLSGLDLSSGTNNVVKSSGTNGWNTGGFSYNKVEEGGYVQTIVNETNTYRMIGLNATNANVSYTDIDYAIYLVNNGSISIYENGTNRGSWGSYSTGDTMRVAVVGNQVRYIQNGNIIYTSTISPILPLYVDMSLHTVGATLEDIFVNNTTYGVYTAFVSGASSFDYQWKLNNVNVGANSPIYTNTTTTNGDTITCILSLTNTNGCSTDTTQISNKVIINEIDLTENVLFSIRNDSIVEHSCLFANEQVAWQSLSALTLSGTNNVTKTSGSNAWSAGGFSYNQVKNGGFMQTIVNETNTNRMIGLNATNTNVSYTDIDYAIYLVNNGNINIYENGTNRGTFGSYSTGDTMRVAVINNTVRYYQNGNLFYTSTIPPSTPLYVDMSIHTIGGTLQNITVYNGLYGDFSAFDSGASSIDYQWKLNGGNVGANSPNYSNLALNDGDYLSAILSIVGSTGCSDTLVYSNRIDIEEVPFEDFIDFYITRETTQRNGCQYAIEDVEWEFSSALIPLGNMLSKPTGTNAWNAGGFSYNTVDNNGFMQTVVVQTNKNLMIGLNSSNVNASYTDIDFAFYLVSGGSLNVYENGTNRGAIGTYTTNDTLRIDIINNVVYYVKNGTILYTSAVAPALPLYVDASLNTTGSVVSDVVVGNATHGVFRAIATDAGNSPNYQWKLNGINVGTNSATYTLNSSINEDEITCVLTPDYVNCSGTTLTSNTIKIEDNPPLNFVPIFTTISTTWTGANTNWYDPSNWSNGVPFSDGNAIIPTGLGNYPEIPIASHLYDLDVANGANLTLTSSAQLTLYHEWTNAGTFTTNTGTVEFRTCKDTSRWSSTNNVTIYDVEMNNERSLVISAGNMHISDSLTFYDGIIYNNSNTIVFDDNAFWKWGTDTTYIEGRVQKTGNDAFTFPIGKNDTAYAPISISAPSTITDHFTAEYFQINPDNVLPTPYSRSLKDPTLDHISGCEYWILDRTNGTSNVNVTLSWDDRSCGVTNLIDLRVARWDGSLWKDHGNGGTSGNNANGTVITSGAVPNFSPFTLASVSSENPLPIELLSFNAELANNVVNLKWQTASEINNNYFTLEKSEDGINWIAFAEQAGAGNSNSTINYFDIDHAPYQGVSYYRLKQTDFNGAFEYSQIVSINNSNSDILIYPNPVKNQLNIDFNSCKGCYLKIYSAIGQQVYYGKENTVNTSNWNSGVYELIIFNQNGVIQSKKRLIK